MKYSCSPWPGLSHATLGTDVPAPCLPHPSPVEGCVEGRGAASSPDPQSPAPCLKASGEPWSSDAADTLALPPWRVPRHWFSLRWGGGGGSRPGAGGPAPRCAPLSVPERASPGPLW